MLALVFPGQGAQFEGMGKELYEANDETKKHFHIANEILGFDLADIMFNGSKEDLTQTKVTQPAVFLYSLANYFANGYNINPDVVAGHSLGEITALVASKCIDFEDGLQLVSKRAMAMQKACEVEEGTMAAVLGLENELVESICEETEGVVVAANYNCPGQLVISGAKPAIESACEVAKEKGARRALILAVGGAFHSPLMEPARSELAMAIEGIDFRTPEIPIYQNVNPIAESNPEFIKENLIKQLTAPVKWTQIMEQMKADGVSKFVESGAKVLSGFVKRFDRSILTEQI